MFSLLYRLVYFLFRSIFNRTVLIFLGVLALCGFVWFAGPLFAFADYRPLASEEVRWSIICIIILLFIIWLIIRFWRRKNLNSRLFDLIGKLNSPKKNEAENPLGTGEVQALQERFSKAMTSLKSLRISQGGLNRLSGRYVYELPWYIIIGAPGSGKTTALINSGLNFPLEEQIGRAALQGTGGTRNCDWWITDEAVIIDTAGRYTTQDTQEVDKIEWHGFLDLLKKYRPRQPINGVILTLSIADLLESNQEQRDTHYNTLKTRLSELQGNFGIELPVYLWVTKADLMAGFSEFFGNYSAEQRKQVWGFTFPYQQRSQNIVESFDSEWRLLEDRLYELQDKQLARETELKRLSAIYSLPQELASLQTILRETIEIVFRESKQVAKPLLRGLYFSSGTQDGTTFDRILSTLRRNFASKGADSSDRRGALSQGKSYFLHDLLLNLIFKETHLAGRNTRWEQRTKWLTYTGYTVSILALIGAIIAWMISYANNKNYLARVGSDTEKLSDAVTAYQPDSSDLLSMIGLLDGAMNLGDIPAFKRDSPHLSYRYGLYQGKKVGVAANVAYQQLLKDGLLPIIAKRLETQIQQPPVDNLEYLYNALKAYLMLHEAEHYDPSYLRQWVSADARRYLLPDAETATLDQLDAYLADLFPKDRIVSSPFPLNDALVAQVRQKLATLTTSQRVYLQLRARLERVDMPEFNILDASGPQAANVFTRRSKLPLNRGIPGLFTYQGYWDVFDKQVNKAVAEMSDDESWVMGLPSKTAKTELDEAAQGKLAREVRMAYLRDYADIWEQYLGDVQLIPSDSLQSSIQRVNILSAPDSPLLLFLRGVVKETTLLRDEYGGNNRSMLDRAKQRITNTQRDIERLVGPVIPGNPGERKLEHIVDDRFEPLRQLVGAPGSQQGQAPIDATLKMLGDYYGTLQATDAAIRSGNSPPPQESAVQLRAAAARLPQPVRSMLTQVADSSSAQTNSLVHGQVVRNLDATVGSFCRRAIAGRYPLQRSATVDVVPDDFAHMFAPGGLMDDFFNKNLASMVDTSNWTFKKNIDGSGTGGSGSLAPFQQASVIRDVFFRNGERVPSLRIEVKPVEMDPSISTMSLDVDGTVLHYSHGPQFAQSMPWPGPGGRNTVLLQITGTDFNAGLQADGPWALFRFFDKLSISAGPSPDKFFATATIRDKKITFEVSTNSVQNPFRLRQLEAFSCPS